MGFLSNIFGGSKSDNNNSNEGAKNSQNGPVEVTSYICPNCGHKSNEPGNCPNCGIPLRKEGENVVNSTGVGVPRKAPESQGQAPQNQTVPEPPTPQTPPKPQIPPRTPPVPQTPPGPQIPPQPQTPPKPQTPPQPGPQPEPQPPKPSAPGAPGGPGSPRPPQTGFNLQNQPPTGN